jgi:hypothetical protein
LLPWYLVRLAGLGWRQRRRGESRERFAARTAALSPSLPSAELTEYHLRWALGSRRLADASGLRQLLADVCRELRWRVPVARRLLGAIHPISWLLSR